MENIEKDKTLQALFDIRDWHDVATRVEGDPENHWVFSKFHVQLAILKVLMEINEKL